jgi:hypothetical protein
MATIAVFIAIGGGAYAASTINGATIKNRTIKGKKLVKRNITRKEVRNDTLTGGQIDESTLKGLLGSADVRADGAASSRDIDNFTTVTFTNMVTKTVNAPKAGYLVIIGTLSAEDDTNFAGGGILDYRLALDGTGLTNDNFYHELSTSSANEVLGASGAVSAVVPVTAGPHTVSLQARERGSGSFILGRDISVVFAPNGSATMTPYRSASASGSAAGPQE